MPYIAPKLRPPIDAALEGLVDVLGDTSELNYAFTRLIKDVVLGGEPRYRDFERAIGLLECCKLELYRAQVGRYEEKKLGENGRV